MGERGSWIARTNDMNLWRAGCGESRTSGSEGGPGRRTCRKAGNAPWSDPYTKLLGPQKWTWFYLYVVIDIYSRYVPGWMLARAERAWLAERLLADTIAKQGVEPGRLTIHADRGSPMASKPVAFLLADLGVTKSHSRAHCSNDNPYSEAAFKTLKYRPEFPDRFGSFEDAQAFCARFFSWSRYAGNPQPHVGQGRGWSDKRREGMPWTSCHPSFDLPEARRAARSGSATLSWMTISIS
jgi:transposase InsO family protein